MPTKQPKRLPPIHPGEILADVLQESSLTVNALAIALRVPANRIGAIIKKYDLAVAEDELSKRIEREVLLAAATSTT